MKVQPIILHWTLFYWTLHPFNIIEYYFCCYWKFLELNRRRFRFKRLEQSVWVTEQCQAFCTISRSSSGSFLVSLFDLILCFFLWQNYNYFTVFCLGFLYLHTINVCREKVLLVLVKVMKSPRSALIKTSIMTSSDIFKAFGDNLIDSSTSNVLDQLVNAHLILWIFIVFPFIFIFLLISSWIL